MKKNTKVGFSLGRKALSSIKGAYFHGGLPSLFLLVFLCMGSMTLQAQFAGGTGRGDIVAPFSNTTEMSAPLGYIVASTDVKNVLTLTLTATGVRISDLHTAVSGNNLIITATNTKSEIVLDGAIPMGITTDGTSTVTVDLTTVTGFAGLAVVGGAAADTVVIGSGGIDLSVTPAGAANQLVRIDLGAAYTNILEAPNTIVSKAGGAIELKNAENFVVAAPLVATLDTVWLSLHGLITQTSPITAGTLRLGQVVNNAVYVLNHASNNVGVVQAITSGTVAYTDADDLRVRYVVIEEVPGKGQSSARGGTTDAVTITSPGAITVDSSGINTLSATGGVAISSSTDAVTIKDGGIKSIGAVTISATGNIDISGNGLKPSDGINQTGDVSLSSSTGGITINEGGIGSNGNVILSSNGDVLFGQTWGINTLSGTGSVAISSVTGAVTINGGGIKSKGAVTVSASGNIVISGNGLNPNDGINKTGDVSLSSSAGGITITEGGVISNGNVNLSSNGAAILVTKIESNGNVNLSSNGDVEASGISALSSTGTVSISSSTGVVSIKDGGINSKGAVSISAPGDVLVERISSDDVTGGVNINSSNGEVKLTLGGIQCKGAIAISANGNIVIGGSSLNLYINNQTDGDVSLTSITGGISFIDGVGIISNGNVNLKSNGDVLLGQSAGIHTLSGNGGVSISSLNGAVRLDGGGIFSKGAVSILANGNIDIMGGGLNPADGINQTGNVSLTSLTGGITISTGKILSNGIVNLSSNGDVSLGYSGGIDNKSGTSGVSISSVNGAVILGAGGIKSKGAVSISANGNVSFLADQMNQYSLGSGIDNLSGNGGVSINSLTGAVTLDGGGIKSKGAVSISATGNIGITGRGLNNYDGMNQTGDVSLTSSAGGITINQGGIGSNGNVNLLSNGDVLFSESWGINTLTGTGGVSITSQTGAVMIKGGGIKSKGAVTIEATGDIDITGNGLKPSDMINQTGDVNLSSSTGDIKINEGGIGSNGNVGILANTVDVSANIAALGKSVRISPYDATTTIRLGGDDALDILGLTNSEMIKISADTLVIGNSTTSSIQLTSAVKDSLLNVALVTTPTTGTLDLVDSLTVKSINLNRVGKFTPSIISTSSAKLFRAYGPVILGNTSLVLPTLPDGFVVGDKVTILQNESTDPVVGTFIGLPEGDTLSGVDMSGRPIVCSISYVGSAANFTRGTVGNDIVLTVTKVSSSISGKIGLRTNSTVGIINTSVALAGDGTGTVTTLADGLYSFDISGSNYTVTPTKTTGKLNGVTALDVTRISQHVGGTLPFTNPLEYIAADINKSNSLNTSDASTLQNALLNNPIALNLFKNSWRFVPTGTMFMTPYGTGSFWNFPEKRTYTGITGSQTDQDFDAIKVGDLVTPSVNPALKPAPAVPVVFTVPEMALTVGALVEVPFRCEHFEDLVALQACFWFNPGVLALDAVLPLANSPVQAGNFGTWELAEGRLRMVWAVANAETKSGNPELFKLRFRVLQGGYGLGDVLHISQKDMEASAWHTDYRPEPVELVYAPVTETQQRGELAAGVVGFELYQNEPNPFADKTTIAFQLPTAATATLTVYDESGRVVFTQKGDYAKGYNAIVLDRSLLKTSGVMYYTLETPTDSATKKMVQIK